MKTHGRLVRFYCNVYCYWDVSYWDRLRRLSLYFCSDRGKGTTSSLIGRLNMTSFRTTFRETSSYGTICIRPLGNSKYSGINTLTSNFFASCASTLYNVVPPNIKSLPTFTSCTWSVPQQLPLHSTNTWVHRAKSELGAGLQIHDILGLGPQGRSNPTQVTQVSKCFIF